MRINVFQLNANPQPAASGGADVRRNEFLPISLKQNDGNSLQFLDGLRGLAAFYVMVGHARWLLWEGYSNGFQQHPGSYSAAGKALMYFFSLFKYGHEAVLFFFVLSGFVIHLRYAQRIMELGDAAKFDWSAFVWRRARRLYPPLLAAIALALLLDSIGRVCGFSIYYQTTPYPVINESITTHLDAMTLFGNLAFLMNTYVPVFGCNGPLWSLKFEWWFYMIYPVFWWITRRSILLATSLMIALFVTSHLIGWPVQLLRDVFSMMLAWWLGVLLADVFARRWKYSWSIVASVSLLTGIAAIRCGGRLHDLGIALGFAALLSLGFLLKERNFHLHWLEKLKPLGDMSYTLYVTHFPILVLAGGWLMSRSSKGTLPQHFGWVFGGIVVTLLIAYGLHFIVERPFLSRTRTRISN